MSFVYRFICKASQKIPADAERKLRDFKEYENRQIISAIDLFKPVIIGDKEYIRGNIYYRSMESRLDLVEENGSVKEKEIEVPKVENVVFFLSPSSDVVLFAGMKEGSSFGHQIISKAMFGNETSILSI